MFDCSASIANYIGEQQQQGKKNNKNRSTFLTIKDGIVSAIDNAKWSSFQAKYSSQSNVKSFTLQTNKKMLANQSVCICVCFSFFAVCVCVLIFIFVLNFVEKCCSEMDEVTQLMSHVNRILSRKIWENDTDFANEYWRMWKTSMWTDRGEKKTVGVRNFTVFIQCCTLHTLYKYR